MTPGEGEPCHHPGAARQAQCLQPRGTAAHAGPQLWQTPWALLFAHLPLDHSGMGVLEGWLRASRLAGARKRFPALVDLEQRRPGTAKASAEKARDPQTTAAVIGSRGQALSHVRGPTKAARRRRHSGATLIPTPCRPASLPSVLAPSGPACGACLRRMQRPSSSRCPWVTGRARRRGALSSGACGAARRSHSRTVAAVTPRPKPMADRAPWTSSIFRAMLTCSAGLRRSKKTGARVSAQVPSQGRQRQMRRWPLGLREVEMALMWPRFISR
jgi:hypothetical protein